MLLTFLRHAEAEPSIAADHGRKLTTKGLEQAAKVGKFCVRAGLVPDVILSSPVVRAVETARIVAGRLGDPEFLVESWLACGMTPETCLESLAGFAKFDHVMLVGHEPDFGEAVAACLGLPDPGALHIRKASLTAVEMPRLRAGAGRLEFAVSARLM